MPQPYAHSRFQFSTTLTAALLLAGAVLPVAINANPTGGVVAAGTAAIVTTPDTVTINQSTPNAVINWATFNVGSTETVNFNQPDANSATLNRIHDAKPSVINGQVNANGRLYLINNNGLMFGKTATVNAGSLIATTHNITDDSFDTGPWMFETTPNMNAKIVNDGNINLTGGAKLTAH